ncbi:MAG: DUF2339 domain-containing protein [Puniceicoccales bacterium]|jgi:uncharacterized membrane protein|nr:DUF2339 domain-containing protein [Puniceicoccales bacterium]
MESLILGLAALLILFIFVMPIWAMARASKAMRIAEEVNMLRYRVGQLERDLKKLSQAGPIEQDSVARPKAGVSSVQPAVQHVTAVKDESPPISSFADGEKVAAPSENQPKQSISPTPAPLPPPLPVVESTAAAETLSKQEEKRAIVSPAPETPPVGGEQPRQAVLEPATPETWAKQAAVPQKSISQPVAPPPLPASSVVETVRAAPPPASPLVEKKPVNWEQFFGAKLIAWVGGLALFLGLVFLIKESFQRGWIPEWLRVTMGAMISLGLIGAGVWFRKSVYRVTAQTLTGTGVVTLYAVVFACKAYYRFPVFTAPLTFGLMIGITIGAFFLAGLMRAQVVAVLGLLAGFLTPILISTGHDSPIALFSYLGLLSVGVLATSWRFSWPLLPPLSGLGFAGLFVGWAAKFFNKIDPDTGVQVYHLWPGALIPMGVALLFPCLYLVASWLIREPTRARVNMSLTALGLSVVAFFLGSYYMIGGELSDRLWIPFGFIFLTGLIPLAVSLRERNLSMSLPFGGVAWALLLTLWVCLVDVGSFVWPGILMPMILLLIFPSFYLLLALRSLGEGVGGVSRTVLLLTTLALLFPGFLFGAICTLEDKFAAMPWVPFGYLAILGTIPMLIGLRVKGFSTTLPVAGGSISLVLLGWVIQNGLGRYSWPGVLEPMGLLLAFPVALLIVVWRMKNDTGLRISAAIASLLLVIPGYFFGLEISLFTNDVKLSVSRSPWVPFGYMFIMALIPLLLSLREKRVGWSMPLISGITALSMAVWTVRCFETNWLWPVMGLFVTYVLLHGIGPVILQKFRILEIPRISAPLAGLAGLLLAMISLLSAPLAPFVSGILVLALTLLAVALTISSRDVAVMVVSLVLSLVCLGVALARIGSESQSGVGMLLAFVCLFSLGFASLGWWMFQTDKDDANDEALQRRTLSIGSCVMPFALIFLVVAKGELPDPTAPFCAMFVMGCLLAWTSNWLRLPVLLAVGLGGTLLVEAVWTSQNISANGWMSLDTDAPLEGCAIYFAWFAGFAALFTIAPFVSWQRLIERKSPWALAALSFPLHYLLLRETSGWFVPESLKGLLPALLVLPALAGFLFLKKISPKDNAARLSQLAWFAGVALGFATLIIPVQFDRQWLTLGWALEAVALCWLVRRIPHRGLGLTALGLLVIVLWRLTLGSEILHGAYVKGMPVFNVYLYTYGVAAVCFLAAAWQLEKQSLPLFSGRSLLAMLKGIGVVLIFLLINIEVADYFTEVGAAKMNLSVTGRWMDSADAGWARGMSFTLAWGLFALGMIGYGIWRRLPLLRWVALGLLGITLLKLFLFDLAGLEQIYRVIALIGTALIAIAASVLYQKFLVREKAE